jgi:enoyl-CoA hydratase/carnithine racemase
MPLRTEQDEHTFVLTLDRPEKMNALDTEMMLQLRDAWRRFREDDELWVAIVTGAGDRAFCSGRDLFASAPGGYEVHEARKQAGADARDDIGSFLPGHIWKPIIAAINGYALAGGFSLALACDFRIAADTARMGSMSVKRNLLGGGQIVRLTRYVPFAKALELTMLGDHIDAEEALRIGLVNAVVPQAELMVTAREWSDRLCEGGPLAVRATKEVAYRALELPYREAARLETEKYSEMLETEDVREGHLAFKERRPPQWKGR